MKKYLGIDLGSKSLGLAVSESGIIASSYDTKYFADDDYKQAALIINDLVLSLKINIVVIGLPRHMHNELGERGKISIEFSEMLKNLNPNIEVILWDERTSTQSAIKILIDGNQSRKKQKQFKDQLAATIILQNYLDYLNKN